MVPLVVIGYSRDGLLHASKVTAIPEEGPLHKSSSVTATLRQPSRAPFSAVLTELSCLTNYADWKYQGVHPSELPANTTFKFASKSAKVVRVGYLP